MPPPGRCLLGGAGCHADALTQGAAAARSGVLDAEDSGGGGEPRFALRGTGTAATAGELDAPTPGLVVHGGEAGTASITARGGATTGAHIGTGCAGPLPG